MGLSQLDTSVRRRPSGLFLDSIELRNPTDGLFGNG